MATEAAKAIEAILMVAQEPVDPHLLAQLLEVSPDRVTELCDELQAAYTRDDRRVMILDDPPRVERDPDGARREAWERVHQMVNA